MVEHRLSEILDGNPIFSAYSPTTRRGIRVIQHLPTTDEIGISYWLDTLGDPLTDPENIRELVIAAHCRMPRGTPVPPH